VSQLIGHVIEGILDKALVSHINPLYVSADHGIDKLVAPHLKVFFFSHMCSREGLEKVKDHSLGFAEERHHFVN
jgi:hypothetical protein